METLILVSVLFLAALILAGGWSAPFFAKMAEKDLPPCPRKDAMEAYEVVSEQLRKETSPRRRTALRKTKIYFADLMTMRQCDCGGCHE